MRVFAGLGRSTLISGLLVMAAATIPEAALGQAIRRIALSPVAGASVRPDSTAASTQIEELVARRLVKAGFETVPATEAAGIRSQLLDSVGGYYSRLTGEIVEEKYRAVEAGTLATLKDRLGADAWLRLELVAIPADFSGGKARWDGASEGVAPVGKGTVMALSLQGVLLRGYGDTLFSGRAGIQVLQKVKDYRIVPVPPAKLLADKERLERAAAMLADSIRARLPRKG
jgi:hypothetical protein